MSGKKGRRRQDHLARRARSEGYHARSVYKLQEIQRKYTVIRRGIRVLDLGAAPGSWTQYAVQNLGTESPGPGAETAVVAVDLQEMSITGATCLRGDFTREPIVAEIAARGPYDLVMSDAAPDTTGNRVVDTGRSEALVESIVAHLPQWLAPGGALVCKIFQGGGEQAILKEVRQQFGAAHLYRPQAVRRESFETYLVGLRYAGAAAADGPAATDGPATTDGPADATTDGPADALADAAIDATTPGKE